MAREEATELLEELRGIEPLIVKNIMPRDSADSLNVVLEVRAGTGGEVRDCLSLSVRLPVCLSVLLSCWCKSCVYTVRCSKLAVVHLTARLSVMCHVLWHVWLAPAL